MMMPTSSVAGMKMKCPAVTASLPPLDCPPCVAQIGLHAAEPTPQHQHVDQHRAPRHRVRANQERGGRQFLVLGQLIDRDVLVLGGSGRRSLGRWCLRASSGSAAPGERQERTSVRAIRVTKVMPGFQPLRGAGRGSPVVRRGGRASSRARRTAAGMPPCTSRRETASRARATARRSSSGASCARH